MKLNNNLGLTWTHRKYEFHAEWNSSNTHNGYSANIELNFAVGDYCPRIMSNKVRVQKHKIKFFKEFQSAYNWCYNILSQYDKEYVNQQERMVKTNQDIKEINEALEVTNETE